MNFSRYREDIETLLIPISNETTEFIMKTKTFGVFLDLLNETSLLLVLAVYGSLILFKENENRMIIKN